MAHKPRRPDPQAAAALGTHEEGTALGDAAQKADEAQCSFFWMTDNVPEAAWSWLALGSIGGSA